MRRQFEFSGTTTSAGVALLHARKKRKSEREDPAELFDFHARAHKLTPFVREHKFAKEAFGRQWRFDFAWPNLKVAVEIEGLVVRKIGGETVVQGRHANIAGFREDCEKYNAAALLGWTVLRFEQSQVKSGRAIDMTIRVLTNRGWSRQ